MAGLSHVEILRCAQDFGCGLPLTRYAASLTPAIRLNFILLVIAEGTFHRITEF